MYESQQKKIDQVREHIQIINKVVSSSEGPLGPFTTCVIRTDILQRIGAMLTDHLKHLEYVMDKEIQ